MYKELKILGIIPARGGSKGVPRKNIKLLAGKPLIAWTILEAKKSKYIDRLILSSEDEEIIRAAKEYGCEVPFVRPKELAQDDSPSIDTVIHAIQTIPEKYDYLCLLQPTSPLRKVKNIDECIEKCIKNNLESCVSVSDVDKHPYLMYRMDRNEKLKPLFINNISRRQALPKIYTLNGAIYISKVKQILEKKKFVIEKTVGFIMEKNESIDIDYYNDFLVCELILSKKH